MVGAGHGNRGKEGRGGKRLLRDEGRGRKGRGPGAEGRSLDTSKRMATDTGWGAKGLMFITPKHDTHTHRPEPVLALTLMSAGCGGAALYRLATRLSKGSMQFVRAGGGFCLRIKMAGCLTKVCAQQARAVVSKVEEPE